MEEAKKPEQPAKPTETCAVCEKAIPEGQASFTNSKPFCPACREQTIAAIKAKEATGSDIIPAVLGGGAAAIAAGIIWGLIIIWANVEIGYIAVGVGVLAGYGVFWATGKKRGQSLQWIASALSLLGILIGKYISFYHFFRKGLAKYADADEMLEQFGLFSGKMISLFFSNISGMLSGYDILWVILAIGAAYKITAMPKLEFTQNKNSITAKWQ